MNVDAGGFDSNGPLFWDRIGTPISEVRLVELHGNHAYRFLARERVGDWEVVTAWLGMDQGCSEFDGTAPLIFGTVAIRGESAATELWGDVELLAATEAEALANQTRLLHRLRNSGLDDGRG